MQESQKSPEGNRNNYTRWFGFGIEFCGVLGVFCYIGYRIDQALNTEPWFLVGGFFVGFAGMFYLLLKETGIIRRK